MTDENMTVMCKPLSNTPCRQLRTVMNKFGDQNDQRQVQNKRKLLMGIELRQTKDIVLESSALLFGNDTQFKPRLKVPRWSNNENTSR